MQPASFVRAFVLVFGIAQVAIAAPEPPPSTCFDCSQIYVTLTSSPNPSKVGQPVTFTVTVSNQRNNVYGYLSDYMRSYNPPDPVPGCPGYPSSNWSIPYPGPITVQCVSSEMTAGSHILSAVFPSIGKSIFGYSSNLTHVVQPSDTTVSISVAGPIHLGQQSLATVTVSNSNGTPTGSVMVNGAATDCKVTLASGIGTCVLEPLIIGVDHPITASYSGDGTFAAAGAATTLTVKSTLDADHNDGVDALTDGLLILRYLFGLRGADLTPGAVGKGAHLEDGAAITAYLDQVRNLLDVDNDGRINALTDGLLLLRYVFGLRGATLVDGAVAAGAMRKTMPEIEAYLESLLR